MTKQRISLLLALALCLPAGAGELTRKVWPAPDESQLDLDSAAVPFERALRYWTDLGIRVKARNPEEYANLRFVGLGNCSRQQGPQQLRLETSRQETPTEIADRQRAGVRAALESARTRGMGLTTQEIEAVLQLLNQQ